MILERGVVYGIKKCPYCGVDTPLFSKINDLIFHLQDEDGYEKWHFTAKCSRCLYVALFYGESHRQDRAQGKPLPNKLAVTAVHPSLESVPTELPALAQRFLKQAIDSKHAPDGAVMLAASCVDAILKDKGYKDGNLYNRIEDASKDHILTAEMREWAHEIRLNANEPRHADDEFSGYSSADAEQIIECAKALSEYMYVLPARGKKWKERAPSDG